MGQSMDGDAMYVPSSFLPIFFFFFSIEMLTCHRHVLIDYREDGITPYATLWKHGLEEMKV